MSFKATLLATAVGAISSTAAFAGEGISIVNRSVQAGGASAYWTTERTAAAEPMFATRNDGLSAMSFGSSILDFTRSRLTPKTINKSKPYRFAGKLYFTIPGSGDFQCTASVIKKRLIVTAAHCLYDPVDNSFYTNFAFIPGFDGSQATLAAQRPFGTWDWAFTVVTNTWNDTDGALPNNGDFGIIELVDQGSPAKTVSATVGGAFTPVLNHLFDTHVSMLGYPCNFDSCKIQQRNDSSDHRPSSTASDNNAFEYGSDMTGGSSGGPWVENLGDPAAAAPTGGFATRNAVVGVTSYGYTDPDVKILGASQFNSEFTLILNYVCSHRAGNC